MKRQRVIVIIIKQINTLYINEIPPSLTYMKKHKKHHFVH